MGRNDNPTLGPSLDVARPAARQAEGALPVVDRRHYEIGEEIAHGGWGRILRARDLRLGRTVAIKQLRVASDAVEAQLRYEASLTARLEHPAIVPVHEVGRWASGELFYAMKLVEGRSLQERIDAARDLDGRLLLLPHVLAVADAAAYAHSRGVIHRDLKPSNVMVGAFGETVVIDWGLATEVSATAPRGPGARGIVGTPPWLPPEQARGEPVDERADVYALGAILYTLITGRGPYTGVSSDAMLECIISEPMAPIVEPGAPRELVTIVETAMARDPDRRYASAVAFAKDLRRFHEGQLVAAHHYSAPTLIWHWVRRHRLAVALGLVTAAVGMVLLIGALRLREEQAIAARQHDELVLAAARAELRRDPTHAITVLAGYGGRDRAAVDDIVAEAHSLTVATHILPGMRRASISPDGRVVAGFDGQTVRVFHVASGAIDELSVPEGAITHLRFAPDSQRFVTIGHGDVREWTVATGVSTLRWHDSPNLMWVTYSDDGTQLAFTDDTSRVHRLDRATGKVVTRTGLGPRSIVTFSPEGRYLAITNGEETGVFDGDAAEVHRFAAPAGFEWFAFAPVGDEIAWGTRDGEVVLYDLREDRMRSLGRHATPIIRLGYTSDGMHLASAATDGSVQLWTVATGAVTELLGPGDPALRLSVAGDTVAVGSASGAVRVWHTARGAQRVLRGHAYAIDRVQLSSDGRTLVSSDDRGETRIWELAIPELFLLGTRLPGGPVRAMPAALAWRTAEGISVWTGARTIALPRPSSELELSADGRHLATRQGSRVTVEDLVTAEAHTTLITTSMRAWALSGDGGRVAASGERLDLGIFPVTGGAPRALGRLRASANTLRFFPDGERLLSAGDGEVIAWSPAGQRIAAIHPAEPVDAVAFASRADRVALALTNGHVIDWDAVGAEQHELTSHVGRITGLAVSPDGVLIAFAGEDGEVWLWRAVSGEVRRLPRFTAARSVAFLADGARLASAGSDGAIRLWDVATTREVGVVHAGDGEVTLFSGPGGSVVLVDDRLWQFTPR